MGVEHTQEEMPGYLRSRRELDLGVIGIRVEISHSGESH